MMGPSNPNAPPPVRDPYDGWDLTNRPAMLPFLAEYTNRQTGEKSGGFAWPSMVTEPLRAANELLNTPSGTLPNPQNPEQQQNALTLLMSLYGGNALNPMAKVPANALASSAFKVEGKPALSKFLRHDEDKSLGDTEVTRYLLNLEDKKVARIPADVTRGSESFGIRGIKRSSPPDTVTQKGYDFYGMDHPELDDYVQYKNLWHSQDGLLNHIDKLSERVAKFGLRGHLTPQEVANSKAYYQKLRDHVSSDDWDGSVFSDTGRPSIAGSAVAGAEAKGARPGPSALQPKAEAMGDGIIAETVDDAYRTFLSKLQDDPKSNPTFGPPTPGVDPTKVREAYEKGLQRWHSSFGKYSEDVPSPYGPLDGRLGDDLPAVMDALILASEASGRQLKVLPRRHGSQYADLTTPTGDVWEVRVADHANQSVHHGGSDFNIAPGAMTQEQFLDLLPTIYSDTGKPSLMGAAVAGENARPGITAYHGSPHDFDKFSLDKIGTGEGAQAYGHGLYFAENEGVAKGYRDALSPDGLGVVARGRLRQHGGDIDKTIEYLRSRDRPGDEPFAINNRQALAELERAKAEGMKQGRMYQVRINANPDDFLDWDKPLSGQSDGVKSRLGVPSPDKIAEADRLANEIDRMNRVIDGHGYGRDPHPDEAMRIKDELVRQYLEIDPTESAWWKFDAKDAVARPEAAAKMREAGIPGIRYLDQGSRAAGEGSRNFVVFDDNIIDILKKYGIAPGMAAGANALSNYDPSITY